MRYFLSKYHMSILGYSLLILRELCDDIVDLSERNRHPDAGYVYLYVCTLANFLIVVRTSAHLHRRWTEVNHPHFCQKQWRSQEFILGV